MMKLIEQSRMAIDELIDVTGRASVEAVRELPARQVTGEPQPGKPRVLNVGGHGRQFGRVQLKERKLRVQRPRDRKKGRSVGREFPVPASEALRKDAAPGPPMLEILLDIVSTTRQAVA